MRRVKWIDEKTGGWKTGVVMVRPDGVPVSYFDEKHKLRVAVHESCCGPVSWPICADLEDMPTHEELEAAK